MFSVYLFEVDRAFGGHEEGGWWFDVGQPVTHKANRTFSNRGAAISYYRSLADLETQLNDGLADLDSVCCSGVYRFIVSKGAPKAFPETRPYYC
jgi:hypothetical protein